MLFIHPGPSVIITFKTVIHAQKNFHAKKAAVKKLRRQICTFGLVTLAPAIVCLFIIFLHN